MWTSTRISVILASYAVTGMSSEENAVEIHIVYVMFENSYDFDRIFTEMDCGLLANRHIQFITKKIIMIVVFGKRMLGIFVVQSAFRVNWQNQAVLLCTRYCFCSICSIHWHLVHKATPEIYG
jgi:hypothetical protein